MRLRAIHDLERHLADPRCTRNARTGCGKILTICGKFTRERGSNSRRRSGRNARVNAGAKSNLKHPAGASNSCCCSRKTRVLAKGGNPVCRK
jgi:hypothetical protein